MRSEKVIGVIPARLASTRFPEKVLADIGGKPMIQHVYEQSLKALMMDELIVACDDEKIYKAVTSFGGKACMTSRDHESGTDRIAEAVKGINCDFIINIQADEPLIKGSMIDGLVRALIESEACMSTLARPMTGEEDFNNPNVVKVVCDFEGYALYFSRAPIPYARDENLNQTWLKHIGLYGYRKEFLLKFASEKPSSLERMERLEQLRALEMGEQIKVVLVKELTIGVDTIKDLEEVKKYL